MQLQYDINALRIAKHVDVWCQGQSKIWKNEGQTP